jgi:hypothetical protein
VLVVRNPTPVSSQAGTCRLKSHMAVGHTLSYSHPQRLTLRFKPKYERVQCSTCMETSAASANKPRVFRHMSYICTPRPTVAPSIQKVAGTYNDHGGMKSSTCEVKDSCTPCRMLRAESRMCVCVRATCTNGTCSQGKRFMRSSLWWLCINKFACDLRA